MKVLTITQSEREKIMWSERKEREKEERKKSPRVCRKQIPFYAKTFKLCVGDVSMWRKSGSQGGL